MKYRWLMLLALLPLAACAGVVRPPPDAASRAEPGAAAGLVDHIRRINAGLVPYKGIGRIDFFSPNDSWSVRAAWLAAPDGRLRVEALGLTGQPFARMICLPDHCVFIFRQGDCLQKHSSGRTSLEPLAGIDVDAGALVRILGGGIPLADHDSAEAYVTNSGQRLLVLKKRFRGTVETIRFATRPLRVREIAVHGWRETAYRARILSVRRVDARPMPAEVSVADGQGRAMRIAVQRCWVDIEPPPAAFSAELPGGGGCGDD